MKQDIRINPKDPARENGRIYPNHNQYIDIDMVMLQSAMLAKRDVKRLKYTGWIFLVAFLLFFILMASAMAETWMIPNEAGGQIVLTDRACHNYPNLKAMYTRTSSGQTWEGCWTFYDKLVHVIIKGENKEHTFEPSHFVKITGV